MKKQIDRHPAGKPEILPPFGLTKEQAAVLTIPGKPPPALASTLAKITQRIASEQAAGDGEAQDNDRESPPPPEKP